MKGSNQHNFSQVPRTSIPRSVFRRDHTHKSTFQCGKLIPFFVDEGLPGDTIKLNANIFARLATPVVPFMDNLHVRTEFFQVPNRILWEHWKEFMGEQADPSASTDFQVPILSSGGAGWEQHEMPAYMGIPMRVADIETNCLPTRAYNKIVNDWYRDENLQDPMPFNWSDTPDDDADAADLWTRAKKHDYFTSCLPWPQKGDDVLLPLGASAPVYGNGKTLGFTDGNVEHYGLYSANGLGNLDATENMYDVDVGAGGTAGQKPDAGSGIGIVETGESGMYADLQGASAANINDLRLAFQTQKLLERDARGGTRYNELVLSHFGVSVPDFRVQRSEYLGGGTARMSITPVQQNAVNLTDVPEDETPLGKLAAYGVCASNRNGFTKSIVEHCQIIGMVSVTADVTYQQGLNRMFSRKDKLDYFFPALSHIGEQPVLSKEIYYDGSNDDELVFGYQSAWDEYRYKPSLITGKFNSGDTNTLDIWHLGQFFDARPLLNDAFIQDASEEVVNRGIAVPSEPQILFDSLIEITHARPMPVYSVPGKIDHF